MENNNFLKEIITNNITKPLSFHLNNIRRFNLNYSKNQIKWLLQKIRAHYFISDEIFLNNPFSFLINLNTNIANSDNIPLCILDNKFFNFRTNKIERFLFLSTNFQINKLGNSKQIFIDGTFKSCPANFFQILIIHAFDFETKIKLPVFFILMTSKTSEIYKFF